MSNPEWYDDSPMPRPRCSYCLTAEAVGEEPPSYACDCKCHKQDEATDALEVTRG